MRARGAFAIYLLLWAGATPAAIDAYPFADENQRARYEALIAELRCPQCLNTNLAGSDAMIAQNLRAEVYRLVLEGKTDEQVRDHLRARYGDFILYRPRWTAATALLWTAPFLLLALAALVLARLVRRRQPPPPLNVEDQARLDALLAEDRRA